MNFLAHAYLSFAQPQLLLGNMISDFVKGSRQYHFPEGVQRGIQLHRQIDDFTDSHAASREAKRIMKPAAHRYAAPYVDVIYDHFLAADEAIFPNNDLSLFALQTYTLLDQQQSLFPPAFTPVFQGMKHNNWLYNYRTGYGIRKSFEGLYRRSKYLAGWEDIFDCFEANYHELKNCYASFFPDVHLFARSKVARL